MRFGAAIVSGAGLVAALLAVAPGATAADPDAYVAFADPPLEAGRTVWLANCEGCHGYGVAGAPIPMKPREWVGRLAKDRAILYDHAINGFFGPEHTMMPARGGNPDLTDEQVKAAVDYMAALAEHYIQITETQRP